MTRFAGKYEAKKSQSAFQTPIFLLVLYFYLIEVFGFFFLENQEEWDASQLWPLAFGGLWAVLLTAVLRLLSWKISRILFGVLAVGSLAYAVGQAGYFYMFSEMMWLSEFRYASEGADYLDVLLSYPLSFFVWVIALMVLAALLLWKFPRWKCTVPTSVLCCIVTAAMAFGACRLPETVFLGDSDIQYARSDYGRMQSSRAAYENMFNPHRLYQVCGLYQTLTKDIYTHMIYPMTPAYLEAQEASLAKIDAYFAEKENSTNEMTGLLEGKNVILILMESMDDWMLGEHTPTINQLMAEGISFANFYTPAYGGIRTFNTEFCINTGSFLSSQGGYAFDYVTNEFHQSLASLLTEEGYSAKVFHYNNPSFYSRGVFSPAMGYEEYVCYADYVEGTEKEIKNQLYDDKLLFSNSQLRQKFFREDAKTLNFIITRSAHLSYKYNEVLSYWGLKQYPEFKGLTGNEETDCALLKARLVDDMFRELMAALEEEDQLENTVIIGVTDHYTYGYKNEPALMALSGVDNKLLLEKTPCFIWSADLEPQTAEKVLNTADLLPTVLNLLGVNSPYSYIGRDAFDAQYEGFAAFSDGSWITGDIAYDASAKQILYLDDAAEPITEEFRKAITQKVQAFTQINNLILDTDYYAEHEE